MAEAAQMEGQNQNAYILKDVFDARMDRMEMLLEKTLLEMKADNEKLRSEVKEEIGGLRTEMDQKFTGLRSEVKEEIGGLRAEMDQKFTELHNEMNQEVGSLRTEIRVLDTRMDGLASRIDGVQTTVYWGFAIVAIVIAFLPTIQDWRRAFRRPSFTLEDIQQRIDAAIAKALRPEALS